MNVRLFTIAALFAFGCSQAIAAPGYYNPSQGYQAAQQAEGPAEILENDMSKLLKFLRQTEKPSGESIAQFVESEIAPDFDFAYMAQWAAGSAYRNMSEEQRSVMTQKVKEMLLTTLSKRLGNYNNQDVKFFRPRRVGKNEVKVRVGILQAGNYPTSIDFRFYHSKDGWKVFDVSANGSSALSYYRQYFANLMRAQDPRAYRG